MASLNPPVTICVLLLAAFAAGCKDETPTKPADTTPRISSILPPGASADITVNISGANFGANQGGGTVQVAESTATVVSWANSKITFTMPAGFSDRLGISVSVTTGAGKTASSTINGTPPNTYQVTLHDYMDQQPSWGANGNWIYFSSTRGGDDWEIWRIPAVGGVAERVTNDPSSDFYPTVNWSSGELAWSSDRNFSGQNPEHDMEIFHGFPLCPAPGTGCTVTMGTSNESRDLYPSWAGAVYGGYDMVYTHEQVDAGGFFLAWRVYLHSAADPVALTEGQQPSFSGDGRWVVYSHNDNIYKIPTDGGTPVQLTNTGYDTHPHWGWSNNKIVYQHNDVVGGNSEDIYIMDTDGSNVQPLVSTRDNEYWPRWSADGTKVVYYALASGRFNLYVCIVP